MEIPGPDGFLLTSDNPLHAEHLKLSDYLLAEEERLAAGARGGSRRSRRSS
jgi:hypothetical protein